MHNFKVSSNRFDLQDGWLAGDDWRFINFKNRPGDQLPGEHTLGLGRYLSFTGQGRLFEMKFTRTNLSISFTWLNILGIRIPYQGSRSAIENWNNVDWPFNRSYYLVAGPSTD